MLKADNIVSVRQYYLAVFLTISLISILTVRFFQLQILDYDQYSKKANTNRIRKVTTSAPRGLILDRNGQILVDNLPTYILNAVPGELTNKGQTFDLISRLVNYDSIALSKNYRRYYRGRFIPTRIAKDLTFDHLQSDEDRLFEDNQVRILVDKKSLLYLLGTTLEYSGGLNGKGFIFNNPNAQRTCGCGESFSL